MRLIEVIRSVSKELAVDSPQRHQMTYDRRTPLPRIGTRKVPLKNACITQTAHTEQTQLPAKLDNS
eukprot:7271262-Ditylum_brightwellii.AAC.1